MENIQNTPTIIPEETQNAWKQIGFSSDSKIGQVMNKTDFELQVMAQKIIADIKIPTKVSEIIESEKLLAIIRNRYLELQEKRKKLTSKFDNANTQLSKSEKLIFEKTKDGERGAIKPLIDAIMSLKKQAESESAKLKYHDDEIKRNKEIIATHISNHDAACKHKIIEIVDKAFSYALGNGNIQPEEVQVYLSKVMKKYIESEFTLTVPMWQSKYTTQEENKELWDNAAMDAIDAISYKDDLHTDLKTKFEFYDIAVKNKVESLRQAAVDKDAAEAEVKKAASEAEVANKLNALATIHTAIPVTTHKDLKKGYEIEIPEGDWKTTPAVLNAASTIIVAFINNMDACKEYLRVKDILALSVEQMSVALCKLKEKDPAFTFGMLKFKPVEKL